MINDLNILALLAIADRETGKPRDGLAKLREGLAIGERTGERWFDAELRRITGELLLKLQVALDQLGAFDNQLAAKRRKGHIVEPEATNILDASADILAAIDGLIANEGI